ncbi:MAG TPA: CaiB/BaiF CoA-transferase family protein [Ktedonobacterales bacterium]|nr:CaiB/BaiF CoA-transferase family protein [Ktedonobacterales bacterium]
MPPDSAPPESLPLDGLRVLDLTRLLPGGYATQMLADLGADVLKIEEPGAGDYARAMPPLLRGVGESFLATNRNKRSAAINLKHARGRDVLLRLVDGADVLIESFRPGVMARLGLAHETLRERNPRLIVCAISGYGQEGPYSQRVGHDLNYIGYAGLLAHLTPPGQPPTLPGAQFADIAGGSLMAIVGILAALAGRTSTGRGRVVDVSMTEGTLALLPWLASNMLNGAPEPEPGSGWLAGALPGYNVYECADGKYVTLAALEPKFWAEFCRRVDRPDLIERQYPRDAADRHKTQSALAAIFRTRTRDEWIDALGDADICFGPVNSLEEALADPQARARGVSKRVSYGDEHDIGALRIAPLMSETPFSVRRGLPALGEHTAEALTEAGFTSEEITELADAGAVALPRR